MQQILENWRKYINNRDEQNDLIEKYFDEKNTLTESQEQKLLNEIDIPDLDTLKSAWDGLSNVFTSAAEAGEKVVDAPADMRAAAESAERTSENMKKVSETLAVVVAQLLGATFWAVLGYKVLKLIFNTILKRRELSIEEMKAKFQSGSGQEELRNEIHGALSKEPGLLIKLLSPLRGIMDKMKKMSSSKK